MIINTYINNHSIFGETLFAEYGKIKIGVPLTFGIRISYLSYNGGENLFFEQPNDMTELATPDGWRVRGGHRLWLAPESEKVYYPDNDKIHYEIFENGITVTQETDPWLNIQKSIEIIFLSENSLKVSNRVKNTGEKEITASLWAITSVAPCGTEYIELPIRDNGYDPMHHISMWDYTSLGDERVEYKRDKITLSHKPTGKKYKIGVGHPIGNIKYINKGVSFEKTYDINKDYPYPDGGVSFETFMCDHMVEIETLSHLYDIKPKETVFYNEIWTINEM